MVLLVVSVSFFKSGYSYEKEIAFEIMEKGDISGCWKKNILLLGMKMNGLRFGRGIRL